MLVSSQFGPNPNDFFRLWLHPTPIPSNNSRAVPMNSDTKIVVLLGFTTREASGFAATKRAGKGLLKADFDRGLPVQYRLL
jgi:hypothetical protein